VLVPLPVDELVPVPVLVDVPVVVLDVPVPVVPVDVPVAVAVPVASVVVVVPEPPAPPLPPPPQPAPALTASETSAHAPRPIVHIFEEVIAKSPSPYRVEEPTLGAPRDRFYHPRRARVSRFVARSPRGSRRARANTSAPPSVAQRLMPRVRLSRRVFAGLAIEALIGCARSNRPIAPPLSPAPPRSDPPPAPAPTPAPAPESPPAPPLAATDFPLFDAFPALARALPRARFGLFPTPVDHAVALGDHLGLGALYIKRDDVSGLRYGGGKIRKLELYLGDALQTGHTTVLTSGAAGSNQAVATAACASELGLKAILLLLPQPADDRVRRSLLTDAHFGATLRLARRDGEVESAARRMADAYVIPAGGSSSIGNAAFVNAAFELKRDIDRGALPEPDVVYLAMGTMGSAAGLAIGLAALGLKTRVAAVRASSPGTSSEARLRSMLADTVAYLRDRDPSFPAIDPADHRIAIIGNQLGAGYARSTRKGLLAIDLARELAGLSLEPTYTGKALAALVDDAPSLARKVVLFWNSHNSRAIDTRGTSARDLPAELRGYFPWK
jgi:D-cysteine desulfhydrase